MLYRSNVLHRLAAREAPAYEAHHISLGAIDRAAAHAYREWAFSVPPFAWRILRAEMARNGLEILVEGKAEGEDFLTGGNCPVAPAQADGCGRFDLYIVWELKECDVAAFRFAGADNGYYIFGRRGIVRLVIKRAAGFSRFVLSLPEVHSTF